MVVPPLTPPLKADLRAAMRAARLRQPAVPIVPPAPFLARLAQPGVIAAYLPIAGEADPALLVEAAVARGWGLALPRIARRGAPMRFLDGDAPREPGPMGLTQPVADARELVPDLILTPLVAFDRCLNRLGQGAGFYDRAFADHPQSLRIGVAWSIQRAEAVPTEPWDVPLHAVITEQGWIER